MKSKQNTGIVFLLVVSFSVVFGACGGVDDPISQTSEIGTIAGKISVPAGTNARLFDVQLPLYATLFSSPAYAESITDLTKLTVKVGTATTNPKADGSYTITVSAGTNIEIIVTAPSGKVILLAIVPEVSAGSTTLMDVDSTSTAVALIYNQNKNLSLDSIKASTALEDVIKAVEVALVDSVLVSINDTSSSNEVVTNAVQTAVAAIEVATGTAPADVSQYIQAARNSLFKSSVTRKDFINAKSNIETALSLAPNDPDANLLGAIIDIGAEADRIARSVLYTPDTIFPVGAYVVQKNLLSQVLAPLAKIGSPVSNSEAFGTYTPSSVKGSFTSDSPQPSEVQAEIEANVMPVITGIVAKLEKVKAYTDSNQNWTFSYPKDPANPSLGSNNLDKADIKALVGMAKIVRGLVYFGLAYNWDSQSGKENGEDTDGDGRLTPAEYFPSLPFGTLKSAGGGYLSSAKYDFSVGLGLVRDAFNEVLAESAATVGGIGLASQVIADINHYKNYLDQLVTSFSGTATTITVPETKECWRTSAWGSYFTYVVESIFDPSYNTGQTCDFSITEKPQTTMTVTLGSLFAPVSDWRNLAPTIVKDVLGRWSVVESLPDPTVNGIFPGGVERSWFDVTTARRAFQTFTPDNNATWSGCNNIQANATLTIGDKTFTPTYCSAYSGGYWLYFDNENTLPTDADVYTYNALYGTRATLRVPGYQEVSVIITRPKS